MTDEELNKFIKEKIDNCKYHKNKKFQNLKKLLDQVEQKSHITQPNAPNLCKVKSISETAFQRAIFNSETSIFGFADSNEKVVNWLDLELPVIFKSKTPRRKCVDLVGKFNNKPFICELKYMKESKGDPPEYGLFELLIYFYLLSRKSEKLDEEKVYHKIENRDKFKWSDISKSKFIILAANKRYWDNWKNKRNIFNLVVEAQKKLGIEIHLFKTEDVDFREQKGNETFYRPLINNKTWREVTEV